MFSENEYLRTNIYTMKTSILKTGAAVLAICAIISSCTKKSDPSLHDKFVGKWKLHTSQVDANLNGVQDSTDPTSNLDSLAVFFTFYANGAGAVTSVLGSGSPFTWSISSDSKYFLIVDSGSTAAVGNYIVAQPGSTFVIKDTTNGQTQWETYVKQ